MNIAVSDESTKLSLTYWEPLVSEWQVDNIANSFQRVIRSLVDQEGKTIGELTVFSEQDMNRVSLWNNQQYPKVEACVHDVVKMQFLARPNAQAICAHDGSFTYRELDRLSAKLASHLQLLNVVPETKVSLCFEKSKWNVVAMLAVLRAGGACVPLDPSQPLERLRMIIHDNDAQIILVAPSVKQKLDGLAPEVMVIDQHYFANRLITAPKSESKTVTVEPSNLAFIIYTSGSTGVPKGIMLEHANICTSVEAHGTILQISPQSRVLQFAAHIFDVSIGDVFCTLMRGGCVCIPSEQDRVNDLARVIREMQVNTASLTPSVSCLLNPDEVPGLRTIINCGEAPNDKVASIWSGIDSFSNLYGPAECTIYSAYKGQVGKNGTISNIGYGMASSYWIVEPNNRDRLAPVGTIGELLIEGPLVARGYLNDPERTAERFIENPRWVRLFSQSRSTRRFYQTGDLMRYNLDGTMDYLGRKDNQIKLHGQRIELGEVEHHLAMHETTGHAMVLFPIKGRCQRSLVAILSPAATGLRKLSGTAPTERSTEVPIEVSGSGLTLLTRESIEASKLSLQALEEHVSSKVPAYMVPHVWIAVEEIPLNSSQKLDRAKVKRWVEEITENVYQQIIDAGARECSGPKTVMDSTLQSVIGRVLNLPIEQIPLDRSFLSLGGDSITAMQVVSRGRAEGMLITVQNILQSKSILQLASLAKFTVNSAFIGEDEINRRFELSPVQRMYFNICKGNPGRFNQSFLFRLSRDVPISVLKKAVAALVQKHSMLRSRFVRDTDGQWSQLITSSTSHTYRFITHELEEREQAVPLIARSQSEIDVERGPVFVTDVFTMPGGQMLFMAAHHLVIDLVSWRVIMQDLEEVINGGNLPTEKLLSFQAWTDWQAKYASEHLYPDPNLLPFKVAIANYDYWSMSEKSNVYGEASIQSFSVDMETTKALLGSCNEALGTEPVEIFLGTFLHSFSRTFNDRETPTIWSEGHGREPWDTDIDLTRTVGWFTTMAPLHVQAEYSNDLVDAIRRTKDRRRKLSKNGWSYFTSRFLNTEGVQMYSGHLPMEVIFNYLGGYQQLEREDSLLRREPLAITSDVSQDTPRMALFEISIILIKNVAHFNITYNCQMQKQAKISNWIRAWEQSLKEAATQLSSLRPQRTLTDFPLLSLDYGGLEKLQSFVNKALRLTGFEEIEDVYPCSPIQRGLLISQAKFSGSYEVSFVFEAISNTTRPVDIERLFLAWQLVVDRHPALRTCFVEGISEDDHFDQVVLKHITPRTHKVSCSDGDVAQTLKLKSSIDHSEAKPPHAFTIYETKSGKVFCKVEINHAIIDAASNSVLLRDLTLAYDGTLPKASRPLYSDYIKYIQNKPMDKSKHFWKDRLAHVEPCHFPTTSDNVTETKQLKAMPVPLDVPDGKIHAFCDSHGFTVSNVLKTVWGLVLHSYTGADQVCFGYLTSGREVPVNGIDEAFGPFVNMLVCSMELNSDTIISELVERVQSDYAESLEHQHCSLAEIQHVVSSGRQALFNTTMSIQRAADPKEDTGSITDNVNELSLRPMEGHDPSEVRTLPKSTLIRTRINFVIV